MWLQKVKEYREPWCPSYNVEVCSLNTFVNHLTLYKSTFRWANLTMAANIFIEDGPCLLDSRVCLPLPFKLIIQTDHLHGICSQNCSTYLYCGG
jgi:hypothetical protein